MMHHELRHLVLVSALAIGLSGQDARADNPTAHNYTSGVYFGDYKPIEPKSLNEVPEPIRRKLRSHLLERLGERYLSRLTFAGGQLVDRDELYRVDPGAKNYKWPLFAYALFFRISVPEKGIEAYYAGIRLDQNGNVMQEIELPPVRRLPLKQDFLALTQAYAIAAKHNYNRNRLRPEIAYNRHIESIMYRLSEMISGDPATDRVIEIDAHSGRVISITKAHWNH